MTSSFFSIAPLPWIHPFPPLPFILRVPPPPPPPAPPPPVAPPVLVACGEDLTVRWAADAGASTRSQDYFVISQCSSSHPSSSTSSSASD